MCTSLLYQKFCDPSQFSLGETMDQSLFLPQLSECKVHSTGSNMETVCSSRAVLTKLFTSPGVHQCTSSTNNSELIRRLQRLHWSHIQNSPSETLPCARSINDYGKNQKNLMKWICTACWKPSCEHCLRPWGHRERHTEKYTLYLPLCSFLQPSPDIWARLTFGLFTVWSVLLCFTPQHVKH